MLEKKLDQRIFLKSRGNFEEFSEVFPRIVSLKPESVIRLANFEP